MSRRRIIITLATSIALLSALACESDPTGPAEEPVIHYPPWYGYYQNNVAELTYYDTNGERSGGAYCLLQLWIAGNDSTLTVKISYSDNGSGYSSTVHPGSYTFNEVENYSETRITKEVYLESIKYKFSAGRNSTNPKQLRLRYYEYRINADGSTTLSKKITGDM